MKEVKTSQWVMGRPAYVHVILLTQELTNVSNHTSSHHKDSGVSKQQKNCKT